MNIDPWTFEDWANAVIILAAVLLPVACGSL